MTRLIGKELEDYTTPNKNCVDISFENKREYWFLQENLHFSIYYPKTLSTINNGIHHITDMNGDIYYVPITLPHILTIDVKK